MTSPNRKPRRNGKPRCRPVDSRLLPPESGLLPADFPQRLTALKDLSGLTWTAFSEALGQDDKNVRRWRNEDVEPSGGSLLAIIRLALRFPGGLQILTDEDWDPTPAEETEEPESGDVDVEDEAADEESNS